MKNKITVVLLAILFIGLALRVVKLADVPAGLHFDEAQAGYNAFLISQTGKNISGEFLPINIDSFGDFRPALISYLSVPLVKILGLGYWSTRLPSALAGTALIILTYFLAKLCFRDEKVSLVSAALLAISPIAIIFSRSTTDGHIDVLWEICAVIFLILAFKKQKGAYLVPVYFFWLLGYFTYQTSRVLSPMIAVITISLCYFEFRPKRRFVFVSLIPVAVYLIFPFLFFLPTPFGQGRFRQVSVFGYPEVQRSLDEQIREDGPGENILASRVFHNKIVGYSMDIFNRYLIFFSPNPMLTEISQPDRYNVPGVGAVTIVEYLGLILAISFFIHKKIRPLNLLPAAFLLLGPLPSAVTYEATPDMLRAVFMFPFWQMVAAFGLVATLRSFPRAAKALLTVLIIISIWQLAYFLHQYFVHEPVRHYSVQSRTTEMESLSYDLRRYVRSGKKVVISEYNGPYMYYLFFNKINVLNTSFSKEGKYFSGNFKIDSLTFRKSPCLSPDDLLTGRYDVAVFWEYCKKPVWADKIAETFRSDGSKAMEIYNLDTNRNKIYLEMLSALTPESSVSSQEAVLIKKNFEATFE